MRRLSAAALLVLLAPGLQAQSFNVDLGAPGSSQGTPPTTYRALGRSGFWNAVGPQGAANLVDADGAVTNVALSFTSDDLTAKECDHPQTEGGDEALLDDKLELPPAFHGGVGIDFADLAPGSYRVIFYAIRGGCYSDDEFVRVDNSWEAQGLGWDGDFVEHESHTVHFASRPNGGSLRVHVEGNSYDTILLSGVQVQRLEDFAAFCFGDGSATPCPCGNEGAPGVGCANSSGDGGLLDGSGSNDLSADDLVLAGHDLIPNQPALLFVGQGFILDGDGSPLGDGLRCAGGNGVFSLGVHLPDAAGEAAWGPGLSSSNGIGAGWRYFQLWYRDPGGPCGTSFNTSNALEVYFQP